MKLVQIGNGIYARVKRGDSVIERYWAKQKACPHTARDPRGQCYQCGHKDIDWALRYGSGEQPEVARYLGHEEK